MRRKLKIHKKTNFKKTIFLFAFATLFFSVGYSLLVQDITINGTVNLINSGQNNEISSDDLKFSYEQKKWYSFGKYYYQLDMELENVSQNDIENWKVTIDIPDDAILSNNWGENMYIEDGKLIIEGDLIQVGEKLTFGCQFKTEENEFQVNTVILNGQKVNYDEPIQSDANGKVNINIANSWKVISYYYQYDIVFTNTNDYDITSWEFKITMPNDVRITQIWGADYVNANGVLTIENKSYNGKVKAGETVTFGAIISSSKPNPKFIISDIQVGA